MHKTLSAVLLLVLAGLNLTAQTSSPSPMRIGVKVWPVRKQKSESGDISDKIQRMSFRVDLRNDERARDLSGGKATVIAFAEDLQDRDESIVILKEEFNVSLDPQKTTTVETKQVKIVYDDKGSFKYGQKYSGYLFVLKDASGDVVNVTGSTPAIVKYAEAALKLKVEDVCDKKFEFVKKGYIRD